MLNVLELESEESGHVQKVEDEREAAKLMQKEVRGRPLLLGKKALLLVYLCIWLD